MSETYLKVPCPHCWSKCLSVQQPARKALVCEACGTRIEHRAQPAKYARRWRFRFFNLLPPKHPVLLILVPLVGLLLLQGYLFPEGESWWSQVFDGLLGVLPSLLGL